MKKVVFLILSVLFLSCGKDSDLLDGKVSSIEGEPIENVLVQVMGTDLNSKTDAEGNFRINTKNRGDELIFTHPKYEMKRIEVGDSSEFAVELIKKTDQELEK
jgi:hypothetical protein